MASRIWFYNNLKLDLIKIMLHNTKVFKYFLQNISREVPKENYTFWAF